MTILTLRDLGFVGGGVLWTPAFISTALWLDAADGGTITTVSGAVSQWNDKSGNGRNATQSTAGSRPVVSSAALNGRQAVNFDTTGKWLEVTNQSPFNYTTTVYLFIVCSLSASAIAGNVIINKGRSTFNNAGWYFNIPATTVQLAGITSNASISSVTGSFASSANTPNIFSMEASGSAGRARANGATVATGITSKASWAAGTNGDSLLIGGYDTIASTNDFEGLAHQIIVMSSIPSQTTIERLEGWAAHYYNLSANLPSTHPYRYFPPTGT